jgi:Family of unknown function (DUF5946)
VTGHCPECGAIWLEGTTCQDQFYQMLYWENENPALGEVHHLTVLCYHLQHPSVLSPEWLDWAKQALVDFVVENVSPQTIRKRYTGMLDASRRTWKIKATPGHKGSYENPVAWSMVADQVVSRGAEAYVSTVKAWAASILKDLKTSQNI